MNLENTNIKVEFVILGDFFPEDITKQLNIQPSYQWRKGDIMKNGRIRECSGWEISTEYQESLDISEQLNQVILRIRDKREELIDICHRKSFESRFCFVITIEKGVTPAMTLNREIIEFAHAINAEFEFDVYVNPYSDSDEDRI